MSDIVSVCTLGSLNSDVDVVENIYSFIPSGKASTLPLGANPAAAGSPKSPQERKEREEVVANKLPS
eukprot:2827250-Heterocapsa_arctica.AAC.1